MVCSRKMMCSRKKQKHSLLRSVTHFLPGAGLALASAALFERAGYGPKSDRTHRGEACTATRCVHGATVLGIGAIAVLAAELRFR